MTQENEILTASWTVNNSLKLWDLTSGELIQSIFATNRSTRLEGEFPYAAQFYKTTDSRDLVAVGGSGSGRVEVVSIRDNMVGIS